jgi:hypothetical protein
VRISGVTGATGPSGSAGRRVARARRPAGVTGPNTASARVPLKEAMPRREVPSARALPSKQRTPLKGGIYSAEEALQSLNSHYLIGKTDQEIAIFRIKDDGSLVFTPNDQFKLDVANIFVKSSGGSGKPISAEKFWKENSQRHERNIVFKPGGTTKPDEHNLWQGFGVEPLGTRRHILSLLRHIWKVICRRDKEKFRYLIRWLAWAVQHPDKCAGVVIVLKSRKQGTGKTTLGLVMLKIFGDRHGALVDDKERLLGRFNDWLEPVCFVLAEEILWAGDHRTADRLKSFITAETIQIERKHGGIRQIPNRLHAILTTNHDHAIPAGVGDRRFLVLDVSDEHACDQAWFDRLYQDLNDGGTGEFLDFLLHVQLGDWHPREILKTAETTEQQRMSGDSISQWAQACIHANAVIGAGKGPYGLEETHNLGTRLSSKDLRDAYAGYCKQHGPRAVNEAVFGKACAEMFGERVRLPATKLDNRRPWGYDVPDDITWQEKLDARLGIKK